MEITGAWDAEAYDFIRHLAKARARTVPVAVHKTTEITFINRWTGLVSAAAQSAYITSVLDPLGDIGAGLDASMPPLSELIGTEGCF